MLIASRDITEKKKYEEQRIKSDRLDSLGIMAGGIAHDFNNLITVVLGNVSLLRLGDKFSNEDQAKLEAIENASKRARDLTLQLLTFSKGGTPNLKEIVQIDGIIEQAADLALSGSKIKYKLNYSKDTWNISADTSQISQVFSNLIINSKQAMSGRGNIEIYLINEEKADTTNGGSKKKYVQITIKDEGEGIEPELINKIFDPYFTTKKTGTGLGLANCYTIIKNHGGFIEVESEVGKYTKFHVYLPAIVKENASINNDNQTLLTNQNNNQQDCKQKSV
ncbi:MAG TPA: ATP-binding protein [Thermodesulfobacteriota bacterium]|nr:ATP-binding protein [Thermodesulfobacteriota bacterium]